MLLSPFCVWLCFVVQDVDLVEEFLEESLGAQSRSSEWADFENVTVVDRGLAGDL